jgi:integrase/recombinase XerC
MANNQPGLKKVGEYWHYSLKVNGQRVHGSTRAKDLATAKKILEEKRKDLLCGQFRIVTRIPTLAELVQEWLKVHQPIHSAKHLTQVEQHARIWLLPAMGSTRIDRISTTALHGLRSRILEAGRSPVTANNMLRIVRLLFGYAMKMHYLERVPFEVKPLRVQKKPRPTVAAPQLHEFLGAVDSSARNPHVAVILRVMVGLGLREAEALGMRWEWFDPTHRTYVVGKAKGKEARVLPVPYWLWSSIHAMPKTLSEWVFPAEDGKPHRAQFCKKALQSARRQ